MPITPQWILYGLVLPAALAAAMLALVALIRHQHAASAWLPIAAALGVAAAYFTGHWAQGEHGNWPHFPPLEATDWIALVLLPTGVCIALFSASRRTASLSWALRVLAALAVAPLVLMPYWRVDDVTLTQAVATLDGPAALVLIVWLCTATLARRQPSAAVPVVMTLVATATGMTILLSSWATLGMLGLSLAAALAGVSVVGLLWRGRHGAAGVVDVSVIMLAGMLISAVYFAQLTILHAVLLGAAPLLAWAGMLPGVRNWRPWKRVLLQTTLVAIPLVIVIAQAAVAFNQALNQTGYRY